MEIFSFDDDEPEQQEEVAVLTPPPPHPSAARGAHHHQTQEAATGDDDAIGGGNVGGLLDIGGGNRNYPRGRQGPPQTLDHHAASPMSMPTAFRRHRGGGNEDATTLMPADAHQRHYSGADAYHHQSYDHQQQAAMMPQFNSYGGQGGYHSNPYSHIDTYSPVIVPGASDSYDEQYDEGLGEGRSSHMYAAAADGVDHPSPLPLPHSMQMTRPTFDSYPYGFHPTHTRAHPAQPNHAQAITVPKSNIISHPSSSSYPHEAPIVSASLPTESSRFDYNVLNDTRRFSPHEDVRWFDQHHDHRQSRSASRRQREDGDHASAAEMPPTSSASISPRRDHHRDHRHHHHGGTGTGVRRSRRHRRLGSSASGRRRHKDSSSPSSIGSASSGSSASSRSVSPEGNISIPRSQSTQSSARSRFGPPLNLADLPRAASLGEHVYASSPSTMSSYMLRQRKADRGPFDARTRSLQVASTMPRAAGRSKSVGDARMPVPVVPQRGFDVRSTTPPAALVLPPGGGIAASGGEPPRPFFPSVRPPSHPECKENVYGSLPDDEDNTTNVASMHNNSVSDDISGGGFGEVGSLDGGRRDPARAEMPKGVGVGVGDKRAAGDAAAAAVVEGEFVGDDGREGGLFATSDVDYDAGDSDSESDYTSTSGDSNSDSDGSDSDTSVDGHFEFDLKEKSSRSKRRNRMRKRSVTEQAAAALQDLEINIRVSNSQRHAVVLRFYPWTQVKDVKDTLQRFAEYPPSHLQKLFFGSRELKNTRTLEDSAIGDGSELICTLGVVIDQNAPPIALFGVGKPDDAETALFSAISSGLAIGYAPSLAIDGLGGTYFVKDGNGVNVAAFKPQDEEPYCPHNPRGMIGELGSATMRPGFKSGGGMEREYAACYLDNGGWCGVPLTTRAEMCHSAFHSASFTGRGIVSKVGSLQSFVHSDGTAGDYGARTFSTQSVHKIGILDIRMLNVDRNDANILVKRERDGSLRLVPIDHGYCLPASLSIEWYDWVWYDWQQAKEPFDEDALEFIRSINIDHDLRKLRNDLHIKDECLKLFVLANSLLIKGAAAGLTLYEIATLLMRQTDNPSPIEDLMAQCTAFSIREREGRSDIERAKKYRRASVHGSHASARRSQTERRHRRRPTASGGANTCRHGHRHAHRRHHRRSTIIGGGGAVDRQYSASGGANVGVGVTANRFRGVSHDSAASSCSASSAFDSMRRQRSGDRAQSVPTDSFMENFMLHQFPERPRGVSHSSSTPLDGSMCSVGGGGGGGAPRSLSQGAEICPESQVFSMSPPQSITIGGSLATMPGALGSAVVEFGSGNNSKRASESSFDGDDITTMRSPVPPIGSKFYERTPPSKSSVPLKMPHGIDLGIFEDELRGSGNGEQQSAPCWTPRLRALAQQSAALASEAQRRQSMESIEEEPRGSNAYVPPHRRQSIGVAAPFCSIDTTRVTPENSDCLPTVRDSSGVVPLLATSLSSASEKDIEEKEIGGVPGSTTPLIVPTTPSFTPKKKSVGGGGGAYVPPSLRRRRAAETAEKMSMSAPADSYMPTGSPPLVHSEEASSAGPSAMSIPAAGVVSRNRSNCVVPDGVVVNREEEGSEDLSMSPHELGGFQDRPSSCDVGKAFLLSDKFHDTNLHKRAPHPTANHPGALSEFIYQKRRTSQMPLMSPYKLVGTMEVVPEHCEATPTPPPRAAAASDASATTTRRSGLSAALQRERSTSERPSPPPPAATRARASNLSLALKRASHSRSPSASPVQSPKRHQASAFTFASSPKASSTPGGGSPRALTPGRNAGVKLSPSLGNIYPPSHSPTRFSLKSPSRNMRQSGDDDSFISMPRPVMQSSPTQTLLTPQYPPPVVLPHREPEQMTIMGNKNLLQRRYARSPSPAQALCDLHRSLSPSFNASLRDDDAPGQPPQPQFEGTNNHPLAPQGAAAGTLSPMPTLRAKSVHRPPAIRIPSPTSTTMTPPFTFSPTNGGGFGGFSMPNRSILRALMTREEEEPAPDFVQQSGLMNAPEGSLAIVPLQRNTSRQSVNQFSSFDLSPMPMCSPTSAIDTRVVSPRAISHEKHIATSSSGGSGGLGGFTTAELPHAKEAPRARPSTAAEGNKAKSGRGRGRGGLLGSRGRGRGLGVPGGGRLARTSSMFLLSDYAKATKDGYASPRKQPTDRRVDSPFDSKNLHSLEVSERQRRKIIRRYVSPLYDAIFMEKANTALDLLVKREAGKKLKKQMQDQPHTAPPSMHGGSPASTALTGPGPLSSSFPDSGMFSLTPPALSTQSSRTGKQAPTAAAASATSSGAYVPPHKRAGAGAAAKSSKATTGGAYVPPHLRRAAAEGSATTATTSSGGGLGVTATAVGGSSSLLAAPRTHRGVSSDSFHSNASSSNASRRSVMGPPVPADLYDDIIFTDDIGDMSEYFEEEEEETEETE